jgi:hypothetical protein
MMPLPSPGPHPDRVLRRGSARTGRTIQRIRRSRMLGWDRNPLRRRTDRVEAGMIAGLIVIFLIAAPALAAAAGHWTRAVGIRQQRAEETWRRVPATVQRGAPVLAVGSSWPAGTVGMRARWTAPDGHDRSGRVPVNPATAVGSSVRVWVSPSGSLTGPPLQRTQLQVRIAMTGLLTVLVLGLLLCLTGRAGRRLLGRHRLADWDRAWRAVEPRWTRQR